MIGGSSVKTLEIATFLVFTLVVRGQTSRGTVVGTVLDQSGAVIRGARVGLTGADTGVKLSTNSNESGVYRFDAVDLGMYQLDVAHPGFRSFHSAGIRVEANRTTAFDPRLEVGAAETRVEVNAESSEMLVKDGPLRGGNFQPREVRELPLPMLNPISLARTLSGATEAAGSTVTSGVANTGGFSVNGQRPRSNNYMLDGTDNNEAWLTGEEQVFTIIDAVEEVSVQTSNFGVEFGRAGGGVFNVITKSGTNELHGTLLWRYQSQRFNSVSNLDKLNGVKQAVFADNVFGFTAGGPVRKNKTFFFAGFQQENRHAAGNNLLQVPTADAVSRMRSLFTNNPRLDFYLGALGDLRGTGTPFPVALGVDSQTGVDRGSVQFATASYVFPSTNDGPQWLARIDHCQSEAHRLSLRFLYDSHLTLPMRNGSTAVSFPGFVGEQTFTHYNFAFADNYNFAPSYTNEFRFSYERPDGRFGVIWPGSAPEAEVLPAITIANVAAPGLGSTGQFHYGNNFLFQETQTKLTGRHAFRYGVELLRQTITQAPAANTLGTISFANANALGYSAFANFLDDYSGPSASISRVFGAKPFRPDRFRQSYFFQDNWKATPTVTLTLGLRYENFGQPANSLAYPAFSGFDPSQFLLRHEVNRDNLDFGPAFGFAWAPSAQSGWLGRLFGDGKSVWRGGYQIGYDDAMFTQLLSSGPAISTPNAITSSTTATNGGRGSMNWLEQLPTAASTPRVTDAQNPLDGNLRNPYTQRWSLGLQRQLPQNMLLDLSYIGSASHRLTTRVDWNPRLLTGVRPYAGFGQVTPRTSEGNSSYHALQTRLDRRFSHDMQLAASYTWSKYIDRTGDPINSSVQSLGNLTSVPVSEGGLKLDRGLSDFDRRHRLTLLYLWSVPGPRSGRWRYALAGWSIAGITTFQSGTPFTVGNGSDRNNDGFLEDRPDLGNPKSPLDTRAIIFPRCATGYQNPDTLSCVNPSDVHWVEGTGFPIGSTVGRNTLHTGGTNNFDLNLTKSIPLGETRRLELRWEALNAFNHPQFIQVPQKNVNGTLPGRFLNRDFTDSGIRSMWVQAKVVF
jgi:hypothetical protein